MGTKISIDKHVSNLDDILEMSPSYFDKIKFESKISPNITQHLKVTFASLIFRFGNSQKTKGNLTVLSLLLSLSIIFKLVGFIFRLKKHI